jgi:poly-gamma-glutamate capsule biosynthesis protein CapA/YwtB (metallophosphatase superfamily)
VILWESTRGEPIAARIAVAGDFLPAGNLALPPGGWRDAARGLAAHFDDVAISFVNLECSLDAASLPARRPLGLGQTVSAPAQSLEYLQVIRCRVVGFANNHSFDFRREGIERTRGAVARHDMIPIGAGRTLHSAPDVSVWHGPGDIRVGFWAAAIASRDLATRASPGVEPATLARASQAIQQLKSHGAQVSIALLHCGCLRTNRLDPSDAAHMDEISKIGFSVCAASHSHRISGARMISAPEASPAFCMYGLGSIVSGYVASSLEREGLVVVVGLTSQGNLARIEVRPVLLDDSGFGRVPLPAVGTAILERFRSLSKEIEDGSSARYFYDDMAQGLVRIYLRDVRAALRQSGIRGVARKAGRVRMRHVKRLVRALIA